MKARVLVLAALVVAALTYYRPLLAQEPQPSIPVTTPAAANQPETAGRPAPNVPAERALPVQEVPSPAAPSHLAAQAFWAIVASYVLQNAKRMKWIPFWSDNVTSQIKAVVGFCSAVATAVGIHFVVTGSILDDAGASITISGLSIDAFKDVIGQWVFQQIAYDKLVKDHIDPA